ncbi:hypothetical protein EHQ53_14815 [Leptospira langatensis]|uniref:Uncharacterized protein n=1 Tax=Leptospira langatensis TaxID=2484983 RepID=A0A5F1ZS75_9LEPT|nr:hypothetical protein [Leptospira langatensis]TGK01751.1 hypothetical protein EHO57_08055 [Leptospira langatensis]TGL39357.1 hypothetical protein EHQ53_14815 [Leptospira langatensis]
MASNKSSSEDISQDGTDKQDGPSFINFELKEHLLAFINSIAEYFETLLLYAKKVAVEQIINGVQAYLFLRVGLFFISLSILFLLGAFFLYLQRISGGDPLPALLGTGGLCFGISLISFLLVAKKFKS